MQSGRLCLICTASLSHEDLNAYPNRDMLDEISHSRIRSVEEWMRVTGFTGDGFKPVISIERHGVDQAHK